MDGILLGGGPQNRSLFAWEDPKHLLPKSARTDLVDLQQAHTDQINLTHRMSRHMSELQIVFGVDEHHEAH